LPVVPRESTFYEARGLPMNIHIRKFLNDEDGITALEYGILAAVVAGVLVAVFRDGLKEVFDSVISALKTAVTTAGSSGSSTG
jgi:pilus assembly protein Flp/PilA